MKRLLRCRVTIFLLLGWITLSVVGYMGKDTIYKDYRQDVWKMPYFVIVFEGAKDGVFWWGERSGPLLPDSGQEALTGTKEQEETPENQPETENSSERQPETISQSESDSKESEETEQILEEKEFVEVDESYFDDAVFIGDSRTVGLREYGGLDHADFFATSGLNVYVMWKNKYCEVDGVNVTLEEALEAKQYKKVYFQIGINEMGRGTIDDFIEEYKQAVERFKELQPDAIIYVQGIMRVAKEKSDTDVIFNNEGICQRNERIEELADNRTVFYIDVNEVVCDEEGNLKEELTFDNLHLYGSKYNIWVDFLKTKGILQ